jgi:hypothetical protein
VGRQQNRIGGALTIRGIVRRDGLKTHVHDINTICTR